MDQASAETAQLSYERRIELDAGMALFLRAVHGQPVSAKGNLFVEQIVELGHTAGRPGQADFLKRAAVLHADAAMYEDRTVERTMTGTSRTRRETDDDRRSPLLATHWFPLTGDGMSGGEMPGSWNWPFARSLLDMLDPPAGRDWPLAGHAVEATDPFVARWYHATDAYLLATGNYGELKWQLDHAARILSADPTVLFDRGSFAELLGLPMLQALLPSGRGRSTIPVARPGSATAAVARSAIPPANQTNAEAERFYRRALAVEPRLVEARVRLARLRAGRGRFREADEELARAFEQDMPDEVAYYAHLFAARTALALERVDEASRHYEEARHLFPEAQSALLGASYVALLRADVAATVDPVHKLAPSSAQRRSDPWWRYHLGAGRDSDSLLRDLWAVVPPAAR